MPRRAELLNARFLTDAAPSMRKELALGTYAVIRIDPVASCAGAQDPELTALAKQLPSKKYLAVITQYNFIPNPQWGVNIVSQGLPTQDDDYGRHEGMCTPIFPTTEHPTGREALRANKDFPWKNCYHHSLPGREWLAASSISREGATGIQLPMEEVNHLFRCFLEDSFEARKRTSDLHNLGSQTGAQSIGHDEDEDDPAKVHPSCRESAPPPTLSGRPDIPDIQLSAEPISHQPSTPSSDPNEQNDDPEPYETLSDVTSFISTLSREPSFTDGDEGFIHALESRLDPLCITPTMDVWLDPSVFDSETLPPVSDFWDEIREISKLYLKWKAKQEAKVAALQKERQARAMSRSAPLTSTVAPKTSQALGSTRLRTITSRIRHTAKSFKRIFCRLLPCGLYPSPKEVA